MAWFRSKNEGPLTHMAVELPLALIQEGETIIAYTPALDLSTCGKNKQEAKEMFSEAVKIFFNDLVENRTLNEVLPGLGWTQAGKQSSWVPPTISQESVSVRVPIAA